MRATAFALLTPFYFLRAGSFVDMKVIYGSLGVVILLFLTKVVAKFFGLYPTGRCLGLRSRIRMYTTLMMCTGLTFGTISALYGLTHRILDRSQYSILVVVVILSAIVPTLFAQSFFEPRPEDADVIFKSRGSVRVNVQEALAGIRWLGRGKAGSGEGFRAR